MDPMGGASPFYMLRLHHLHDLPFISHHGSMGDGGIFTYVDPININHSRICQFFVTFWGWLSDFLERLSDLQLGVKMVTLNHLVNVSYIDPINKQHKQTSKPDLSFYFI